MKKLILFTALCTGLGFVSCEKAKEKIKKEDKKEYALPEGWKRYKYTLPAGPLTPVKLAVDNDGVPFILTNETLYKLNGETFATIPVPEVVEGDLMAATFDTGNNLFIAYSTIMGAGGISRFDGINWTRLNTDKGFNAIFKDKSGNLFAGTNDGLFKYNGTKFEKITGFNGRVLSIVQDNSGAIWFGSEYGVIAKYSGDTTFTKYKSGTNFPEEVHHYLDVAEADASGNVYFTHGYISGSGASAPAKILKFSGSSGTVISPPDPSGGVSGFSYTNEGVMGLRMIGSSLWSLINGKLVGYFDGALPLNNYISFNEECNCSKGGTSRMWDIKSHGNTLWVLSYHDDDNTESSLNFGKPETGYLYSK